MLCAYVLLWKGSWEDHFHLVEFAYNNSYQVSIWMEPYKALYWRRCISPLCRDVIGERSLIGLDWVQPTHDNVHDIRKKTC
jgi:hypothetical protein